jgi:hypothetical protein
MLRRLGSFSTMMGLSRIATVLSNPRARFWLELAVFGLGLALRVEHAVTFDGPFRGSDYGAHLQAVRWMGEHWRAFRFDPGVNPQASFYPPLWYALAALVLKLGGPEKAIAGFAVAAWVLRHWLLGKLLRGLAPGASFSRLVALAIHAVLPLSVLIDGKVNPEGLHSGAFVLAAYFLYRIEREAGSAKGVTLKSAGGFGLSAGLAVLIKATGGLLLVAAACVFGVRGLFSLVKRGVSTTFAQLVRPALFSAVVWWAVAGFWCGPNLVEYHDPFPLWNVGSGDQATPALYRRPLGWALPFYWRQYWSFPIARTPNDPLPNFWAAEISGTWSDFYNRGFCRLKGGETTDRVWGGLGGFMSQGSEAWSVNTRCVNVFASLLHVGVWITAAATFAVFYAAYIHFRSRFRLGSLGLPVLCVLSVLSGMSLALLIPFDNTAVLNARYLLPAVTPMCACFGFALGRLESGARRSGVGAAACRLGLLLAGSSVALVAVLLLYLRFGA